MRDPAKWQVFSEQLEEAKKWCEQGIPHQIIRVRFPLPNWVSAATFLDKYGSGEKYDYFAWWSKIQVPVLWLFGEQEVRQGSVNFRDVDLALSQRFLDAGRAIDRNGAFHRVGASESSASIPGHDLVVIQNADHSYRKERDELSQAISRWILASENR